MKILSIQFKNFESYGNKVQNITFDTNKSELYLCLGQNGAGKSAVANVIKFLLYGKVDGVNLTDLPNRINKNLWGKIRILSKGNDIEIERGLMPNVFNVVINGIPYDQAGKLNVQDYIEREYFDIPFIVFKNVVVLSINDFRSFLTMNPGDKKGIIDKLFGFSVINEMKETLRKKRKDIDDEIDRLNREIGIIDESIVSVNRKINELKESTKVKNEEIIDQLKTDLTNLNDNRKKQLDNKLKLRSKIQEIEKLIDDKRTEYQSYIEVYNSANEKLNLYNNKKCPTCEADLDSEFYHDKKLHYTDIVKNYPKTLSSIKKNIEDLKKNFITLRDLEHEVVAKISSTETIMRNKKQELLDLSKNLDFGNEFKNLRSLIEESSEKENLILNRKKEVEGEIYYMDMMFDVLSDGGIKNLAMKTILPALNSNIASLIKKIHLPFTIVFDDKFDAIVNSLGHRINAKTMSTGERKKADFIIIITLIKLIKLKYPTLNILFLDEIFSSIDADGRYTILQILNETIKEIDLNTFVINHSPLPVEVFDKQINIEKKHGFSNLTIEKIN